MKLNFFKNTTLFVLALGLICTIANANPHCEIPCGIYEDSLRINLIKEHITTIEKSMKQINELSAEPAANVNQLVRWVNNKESHAKEIQDIVAQYFLHQRVKIADPKDLMAIQKYQAQLSSLHEVLVYAMKSKQTTDLQFIEKMRESVNKFEKAYFVKAESKGHDHPHPHPHKH